MSLVVPIFAAAPDCGDLPTVPHYTVIYVVDKIKLPYRLPIGRDR